MIFGQNRENTTVKKARNKEKGGFLNLKPPTFCQKSQLIKLAQKLRKSQLIETNLDPNC